MSVFKPTSRHLREVLIFCFHLKKTAAEVHRMLSRTYGEATLSERTCHDWLQCFMSSNFDVEDRRFWCRWPSWRWKRENFRRYRIGGITCWRIVPNVRGIDRIIGSDSTSHFETPQSHGNDSEARKLGSVRVETEGCWTAFLCLWTATSKIKIRRVFYIALWPPTKNGSTTIIPSAKNHGECPDMPPRRRSDWIFMVPRLCSAETEWNHHRRSVSSPIDAFKPSIEEETATVLRVTTKLSSSMKMLGHISQDWSRHTWERWNRRSYHTHRTLQTLLLPTAICFDRWHTAWLISISTLIKMSKRGSPQNTHRLFEIVSDNGQKDGKSSG